MAADAEPRIPAWKRIGLKLASQDISPKRSLVSDRESVQLEKEEPPLKKRKSVTFANHIRTDDGSKSQQLLSAYMNRQHGGEDEFTDKEASKFMKKAQSMATVKTKSVSITTPVNKRNLTRSKNDSHGPTDPPEFIAYLDQFSTDKQNWKFNKHKQTQLLKNAFDEQKLSGRVFEEFLSYIKALEGQARQRLIDESQNVLQTPQPLTDGIKNSVTRGEAQNSVSQGHAMDATGKMRDRAENGMDQTEHREIWLGKLKRAERILANFGVCGVACSKDLTVNKTMDHDQSRSGVHLNPATSKRSRARSRKTRTGRLDDAKSGVGSVDTVDASISGDDMSDGTTDSDSTSSTSSSDDDSTSDSDGNSDSDTNGDSNSDSDSDSDSDSGSASSSTDKDTSPKKSSPKKESSRLQL